VLKTALQIHNILRGRGTFTFLLTVKFTWAHDNDGHE
jgi:hypothetical protein